LEPQLAASFSRPLPLLHNQQSFSLRVLFCAAGVPPLANQLPHLVPFCAAGVPLLDVQLSHMDSFPPIPHLLLALVDTQGVNASLHIELADKTEMLTAATTTIGFLNKRLLATKYAQAQFTRQQIHKLRAARADTQAGAEATIIAAEVVDKQLTLHR